MIALLWLAACRPAPVGPPNLLVVVADDLGVDNVTAYGVDDRSARTPRIDALAADGTLFTEAWAYPECSPTRAALLTGRYGRRTGVGARIGNARVSRPYELPTDERTLPELLPDAYTSAAVGKWHLTNDHVPDWVSAPRRAGFDSYAGPIGNLDAKGPRSGDYFDWEKVVDGRVMRTQRYATSDTVDDALARATTLPQPWLLYVAFPAPHAPFHEPPAELLAEPPRGRGAPGLYRSAVEAMDHELGRLLDGLPEATRRNTVIVFLGDNGTPRDAVLAPLLPERSKNSLFEGGIRVPLIVSGPGVTAGARSAALVHVVDLLPTALAIAGAPPAPDVDGQDLGPALRDPAWAGREFLYAETFADNGPPPWWKEQRAVRDRTHKLMRTGDGKELLFDLAASGNPLLEGDDLLATAPTAETLAIRDRLAAALDRITPPSLPADPTAGEPVAPTEPAEGAP